MSVKAKGAGRFYDGYHSTFVVQDEHSPIGRLNMKFYRQILSLLRPEANSRLLDLSCGQGMFLKAASLEDPSLQLFGLDISKIAVDVARQRVPLAKLKVGDALRTAYPANYFDRVSCLGALEHYPDSALGLKEIHRILKDDGRAAVYVPNLFFLGYIYLVWKSGETPHEAGQNEYEHFETRQGWQDMMEAAGFKVLSVTKYNDMYATERVPAWMRAAYTYFVQPFVPLNLSYCFCFLLEKK